MKHGEVLEFFYCQLLVSSNFNEDSELDRLYATCLLALYEKLSLARIQNFLLFRKLKEKEEKTHSFVSFTLFVCTLRNTRKETDDWHEERQRTERDSACFFATRSPIDQPAACDPENVEIQTPVLFDEEKKEGRGSWKEEQREEEKDNERKRRREE